MNIAGESLVHRPEGCGRFGRGALRIADREHA